MTRDENHRRALELQFPEEKQRYVQNAVSKTEQPTMKRYTRGSRGQLIHQFFTAVRVMKILNDLEGAGKCLLKYSSVDILSQV